MSATKTAALTAALCLSLVAASAHPVLKSANPAANGTLSTAAKEIRLVFSEAVVPAFSGATLTDRNGRVISTGIARTEGKRKMELILPLTSALPEGPYRLAWYAVAADTHRVQGSYAFFVKK